MSWQFFVLRTTQHFIFFIFLVIASGLYANATYSQGRTDVVCIIPNVWLPLISRFCFYIPVEPACFIHIISFTASYVFDKTTIAVFLCFVYFCLTVINSDEFLLSWNYNRFSFSFLHVVYKSFNYNDLNVFFKILRTVVFSVFQLRFPLFPCPLI